MDPPGSSQGKKALKRLRRAQLIELMLSGEKPDNKADSVDCRVQPDDKNQAEQDEPEASTKPKPTQTNQAHAFNTNVVDCDVFGGCMPSLVGNQMEEGVA